MGAACRNVSAFSTKSFNDISAHWLEFPVNVAEAQNVHRIAELLPSPDPQSL